MNRTFAGKDLTALAQAPFHGLCRVVASELSDLWGALNDTEDYFLLFPAIKYVQGLDVIRLSDGIPRTARLRPFSHEMVSEGVKNSKSLLPLPEGTYIITEGIGALDLEIADFSVEEGARRLFRISRRGLPPRVGWGNLTGSIEAAAQKIKHLENLGATIHVVGVDIGDPDVCENLKNALDTLSLPQRSVSFMPRVCFKISSCLRPLRIRFIVFSVPISPVLLCSTRYSLRDSYISSCFSHPAVSSLASPDSAPTPAATPSWAH